MLNRETEAQLEQARQDLEQGEADKAKKVADAILEDDTQNVQALQVRAQAKQKQQDFGGALNDYHRVLELDPSNERAQTCINMINDILYIQNNHFVEDPYTDENHIEGL